MFELIKKLFKQPPVKTTDSDIVKLVKDKAFDIQYQYEQEAHEIADEIKSIILSGDFWSNTSCFGLTVKVKAKGSNVPRLYIDEAIQKVLGFKLITVSPLSNEDKATYTMQKLL